MHYRHDLDKRSDIQQIDLCAQGHVSIERRGYHGRDGRSSIGWVGLSGEGDGTYGSDTAVSQQDNDLDQTGQSRDGERGGSCRIVSVKRHVCVLFLSLGMKAMCMSV